MRRWGFRAVLTIWALALVGTSVAVTAGLAWRQIAGLAREEALARAGRAGDRALEAMSHGLEPALFEQETGVEIVRRGRAEIAASYGDPRVALWREALERGRAQRYLAGGGGAIAALALPGTPPEGIIEARIADERVMATPRRFARRLALAAAAIALAALTIAWLSARRFAAPLELLAGAASRIGSGDFGAAVERVGGAETVALAGALDGMRRTLLAAQGELEGRRAELEAVVAGVAEGVLAVDRDRRVRFLSAPAAALLGVEPAAALGKFCGDLLRPAPVGGVRPCDEACPILHARFRGPARAVERIEAGGRSWPAVVAASAGADGLQVVILSEESAGDAARRARDAAVADLAHELQTPLAAQSASLELLRDRLQDSDRPALDLVLALEAGTFRLRRLIDNLLESVRIESGQLAIRHAVVDLEVVIEDAVAMTRPLLERRRQRLEQSLPHPLPATSGDAQRLGQVVVNLIANASKFGPEDSIVRLGATVAGGAVELWIEDEGPGFPDPARAADPGRFRRGPAEPAAEGSGLGLWICRSILDRHGGELAVERRDGRTRVVARLPRAEAA